MNETVNNVFWMITYNRGDVVLPHGQKTNRKTMPREWTANHRRMDSEAPKTVRRRHDVQCFAFQRAHAKKVFLCFVLVRSVVCHGLSVEVMTTGHRGVPCWGSTRFPVDS
jgi:hypothetical protein